MPLAPHTDNFLYGKGHLMFKPTGESGFLHFGNVPDFGVTVEVTKEDHYSSMTPTRTKDKVRIQEKSAKSTISLEEFSPENLNLAWMGDGVSQGSQAAGVIDAQQTTLVADRFVELGKYGVFYTKVGHGAVSGGPFVAGETVTGGTSSATGKVAWVGTSHLELANVTGTFVAGETLTGGTSTATATSSSVETVDDAVVTDAATPTARYTLGTDYSIQADGGLIRELSDGSIASNTAYVSCDYGLKTTYSVNALVSSAIEGELLFIGTPEDGPKNRVQGWKVSLTITGEAKLISDGISAIPMEAEFLDDSANHPSNPFFLATIIE